MKCDTGADQGTADVTFGKVSMLRLLQYKYTLFDYLIKLLTKIPFIWWTLSVQI